MKTANGNSKKLIDYFFWIVLILFTNPGGILQILGENEAEKGINIQDFIFIALMISFVLVFNSDYYKLDKTFIKVLKFSPRTRKAIN